jgi:hypothetical protein
MNLWEGQNRKDDNTFLISSSSWSLCFLSPDISATNCFYKKIANLASTRWIIEAKSIMQKTGYSSYTVVDTPSSNGWHISFC